MKNAQSNTALEIALLDAIMILDAKVKLIDYPSKEKAQEIIDELLFIGRRLPNKKQLQKNIQKLGYLKLQKPTKPWWKRNPFAPKQWELVIGNDICLFTVTVWL